MGWNVANVGAVAETVADGYGVGLATVGLLTTVLLRVHLLVQLPAGRVVDARGRTAAARTRPDALGAAVALVNGSAGIAILAGIPLLGLAFSLPGEGRIGLAIVAGLWAAALLALPREAGLDSGRRTNRVFVDRTP